MTARIPGLSVIGEFILLPAGSTALNVRHIRSLQAGGREDPDHPHSKSVHLIAFIGDDAGSEDSYIIGRFENFLEAKDAMEHLLKLIAGHEEEL